MHRGVLLYMTNINLPSTKDDVNVIVDDVVGLVVVGVDVLVVMAIYVLYMCRGSQIPMSYYINLVTPK